MLLPSGKSAVAHNMLQTFDLSQSSTLFSPASVRRLCFQWHCLHVLITESTTPSASLPYQIDEAGVRPPHPQGVSHVLMELSVLCFCGNYSDSLVLRTSLGNLHCHQLSAPSACAWSMSDS